MKFPERSPKHKGALVALSLANNKANFNYWKSIVDTFETFYKMQIHVYKELIK